MRRATVRIMGRQGRSALLVLALWGGLVGTAGAASPGSTDDLRLTTTKPGHSTGVYASEIFNARYPDGQLKPLRHSTVGFPDGTTFDALATDTCAATDADFKQKGMAACPESSKIGDGQATVTTTGSGIEIPPLPLDVTVFARDDGSLMVFSEGAVYLSSEPIVAHGTQQDTTPTQNCMIAVEQPPCPHGEIVPRSLTVDIPAHSRVIDGVRHNMITTPRRCPRSGHWRFYDEHTFADGSVDLFVNHPRCRRR
jgi:hypothetical protein